MKLVSYSSPLYMFTIALFVLMISMCNRPARASDSMLVITPGSEQLSIIKLDALMTGKGRNEKGRPYKFDATNRNNPNPSTLPDTIPAKKYQKFIRLDLTRLELERIVFITDSLIEKWGAERGGSEIERAKSIYYNHRNYWIGRSSFDSVLIQEPKTK